MRELSLFSGAGGGLLATKHLLNWRTVGYVEFNEYCQKVIAARIRDGLLDDAPIFGDIRAFIDQGYARLYRHLIDVVSGGFPCQDISNANSKGLGLDGERSGLWREFAEVIRIVRPRYAFVENSPALAYRGLGRVLGDLAGMGFDARWGVFSACSAGAPHVRRRMFILAYAKGERPGQLRRVQCPPKGAEKRNLPWPKKEPECGRMVDGMALGLDRFKAIGNGQVPAVAATAWRILGGEL